MTVASTKTHTAQPKISAPEQELETPAATGSGAADRPSAASEVVLDTLLTRDLWARRLWLEWLRQLSRVAGLFGVDALATGIALLLADAVVDAGKAGRLYPAAFLIVVMGQAVFGTYGSGAARREFVRLCWGAILAALSFAWMDATYASQAVPGAWIVVFALALVGPLWLGRAAAERVVRLMHFRGVSRRRALIVGMGTDAWEIIEHFRNTHERSMEILGHLAPRGVNDPTAIGQAEDLGRLIGELDVAHVIVSARVSPEEYRPVARDALLRGATISVIAGILPESSGFLTSSPEVVGWPALQLRVAPLQVLQVGLKRLLDVVGAASALIVFAPLFAALAVAIKLDSPGPVFFRQRRPGLGGRPFCMLKFRSMRRDAEEVLRADEALYGRFIANGCKLPSDEDPRISRLGRFLRSTSLDELPQLVNVLRGEMSLVGPRPVIGPELEQFGEYAPLVLSVKPGMTGNWQVRGRSTVGPGGRAELDVEYIRGWSLGFDIKILVLTIPAVIRRTGAH